MVDTIFQGRRTTVFSAKRLSDGLDVIIKTHTNAFPDSETLARFRKEFRIGQSINSSYVVNYLALEKCGHGLALIMEDNRGSSLSQEHDPRVTIQYA